MAPVLYLRRQRMPRLHGPGMSCDQGRGVHDHLSQQRGTHLVAISLLRESVRKWYSTEEGRRGISCTPRHSRPEVVRSQSQD